MTRVHRTTKLLVGHLAKPIPIAIGRPVLIAGASIHFLVIDSMIKIDVLRRPKNTQPPALTYLKVIE